jgi:hypothetical protein
MTEYERPKKVHSRRDLCTGALRYAALAVLTADGAALYAKRRRLLRQGVCINDGICAGCTIFKECELPPALWAKKIPVGVNRGRR